MQCLLGAQAAEGVFLHQLQHHRRQRDEEEDAEDAEELAADHGCHKGVQGRKPHRFAHHPGVDELVLDELHRKVDQQSAHRQQRVHQPCVKDWNDVLVHRAEVPNRNYFKSIVLKEPTKPETVKIIRMSNVELTPVEWLWKPYLPFGKLSILQGNPGEGKTYFAMHLAAACTNGKLLPNMERMEPFNVIYQTAEDGLGDTVKPRLIEAGADLDRVLVIDDSDVQLTLSDEQIEKAIIENNARLVIIDPIQAYLGADVDMNRANEVL